MCPINIISFLRKKNFFLIKKITQNNHTQNIIFLHAIYYTYNFIYFLYYQRIFPIYLRTSKSFKFPNIQKKKRFPPWKSKIQINSTFHKDHSISTWIGEKETRLDGGDGESGSDVGWCSSHRQATRSKFRVRWEAVEDLDSPLYIDRAYVARTSLQWCTWAGRNERRRNFRFTSTRLDSIANNLLETKIKCFLISSSSFSYYLKFRIFVVKRIDVERCRENLEWFWKISKYRSRWKIIIHREESGNIGRWKLLTGSFFDTGNSIFYDDSSGESFYRFSIDEIQAARNSHL